MFFVARAARPRDLAVFGWLALLFLIVTSFAESQETSQPAPPSTSPNGPDGPTLGNNYWAAISVSTADWTYGTATGFSGRASAEAAAVIECQKLTISDPNSCIVQGMSSPPFTGVGWHCEKEDDKSVSFITTAHYKGDEIGAHMAGMRQEATKRGYHPSQCWPIVYVVGNDIYSRKKYDLDKTFPR